MPLFTNDNDSIDILFIDPPCRSLKGDSLECCYSIGLVSVATYLKREGVSTAVCVADLLLDPPFRGLDEFSVQKFLDGQKMYEQAINDGSHHVWVKIADVIKSCKPRAVCIPYRTTMTDSADKVASIVKTIDPKCFVIAGSHHATFCPEDVLSNPSIDFVVRGEGELPLMGLVNEIISGRNSWDSVQGISFRSNYGEITHTIDAPLIDDLDTLPLPDRDLVLFSNYNKYRIHYVSSARGCPYSCRFCSDKTLWRGKVRRRSVGNVIEELKQLKTKYKIQFIYFSDGTFTYDKKYLYDFCNKIIDEKIHLFWGCTARYDTIDEDMLKLMKSAGCCTLYFGLESGSPRILEAMDKKMSVETMIAKSEIAYRSGLVSMTAVLLGLPGESADDIQQTLDVMRRLKTNIWDVNCYVPLPGTPMYDEMELEEKRALSWTNISYKSYDNCFSKNISSEDLKRLLAEACAISEECLQRYKRNKQLILLKLLAGYWWGRLFARKRLLE